MRTFFIISVLISISYCDFDGLNKFTRKTYSKGNYVKPNGLENIVRDKSKILYGKVPLGLESNLAERSICPTTNSAENSIIVPLLVRRFVNLLLSKAHFKDSEGNSVPLDSVSDSKYGELSMSIMLVANPSDLETLREFGTKKHNLTVGRIDELLSNLFSADPPPQLNNDCKSWPWDEVWTATLRKVDGMKVLHIGICVCFLWILKRIYQGKNSWMMLILGVVVSSIILEAVRMLEEETIKQHSEMIRRGNIPEHCLGNDNRSWWQKVFGDNTEEECYKYYLHKDSNPLLKVSFLKAALNQLQLVLDLNVNTFRKLIAGFEDQWFLSNWIYQILILSSIVTCVIVCIVIRCGGMINLPFFLTVRRDRNPVSLGSQAQLLPVEDTNEAPIRPPPRRKNGNKKIVDEIDGSSSSSTVIFNIKSGNFHFRDPSLPIVEAEKERTDSSDQEKKNGCTLCGHNFITEKGERLDEAEEESDAHADEDVNSVKSEKTEKNPSDKHCDNKIKNPKDGVLGGSDEPTT